MGGEGGIAENAVFSRNIDLEGAFSKESGWVSCPVNSYL